MRYFILFVLISMTGTSLFAENYFTSVYDMKIGVVQTMPGLIVTNTDKDSEGHIQAQQDYGATIGLHSSPSSGEWLNFFIHLNYYDFVMDKQKVGNDEYIIDLDNQVTGRVVEMIPGMAVVLHFSENSYLSLGIGYGVRSISIDGKIYLTDNNITTACSSSVASQSSAGIRQDCETYGFNERIMTNSGINLIDLRIGDFLLSWTQSMSNSSGSPNGSPDKKSIDEHQYTVAITTLALNYLYDF